MVNSVLEDRCIVFFDGVCNVCNGFVDFVLKNNVGDDIYFSSLQSAFAKDFLDSTGIIVEDLNSIYVYNNRVLYKRSEAVRQVLLKLKTRYRIVGKIMGIVPIFISDFFYKIIARNRYKIAGKRTTCRIPSPSEKALFMDDIKMTSIEKE